MSDSSRALDRATNQHRSTGLSPRRIDRMSAGFDVFESVSMPTSKDEQWKYTDLQFDLATAVLADDDGTPLPPGAFLTAVETRSASATIVDGAVTSIEPGSEVTVESVAGLGDEAVEEIVDLFDPRRDKFSAARVAFGVDGVRVRVPDGVEVRDPVVIDVQATSAAVTFPYVSVQVGRNAECSVIVVYRSAPGIDAIMAPQVGLHADEAGRIRFLGVQSLDAAATGVVHQRAVLGRDATIRIGEVGLGGSLGRLDLVVDHIGDGSSSEVVGVFFGEGDQTLDYRMVLHHQGKRTSSDVLLKGAVEDRAQSVFTGLLKIDEGAVRTSAFETNRNLVLSEEAKAHSVPNLEILCDDVICGHGSSVGPLEEEHLYYLQTRGLSRATAEQMLVKAFFREIIDRLPVEGLADPVAAEVFSRFVTAQEEGRL